MSLLLPLGMQGGCASSQGPEMLTVDASQYQAAFDAAAEAARIQGMPPILQDRRAGVIETDARVAASLVEPWRDDNASFHQAVENTLSMQRRRARFEFVAVTSQAPGSTPEPEMAPSVAMAPQSEIDLTQASGPVEVRVRVFVDRAQSPGVRRGFWSRSETTTADLVVPEGETRGIYWVPITRDKAFERRLLQAVQDAMLASGTSS